ncbi:DUF3164 family protein [Sulfurimonas sp.]|uniref:DUF3164 family protein n=1 Tax=Sulfurimonas sp. TaxID=2022749 RepID=UPI00261B37E8|nr:DUF3164 family protein [Sulfurimonas sp.]MDD3452581.1 DUF3164 family protein [Sulfurimonas sp.]
MSEVKMWINKRGDQVHPDLVPHEEKLKTELVQKIIGRAEKGVNIMMHFKKYVTDEIGDYMGMMREKYGLDPMRNSPKGNLSIESYDGLMKVQIAVQQHIDFDEKLLLAKEKIDEYLKEITADAGADIQTLITKVFDVDKQGNVNAKMILSLKGYKISHPKWKEAMEIIDEAVEIVGSKSYIRFMKRKSVDEKWENISLDFASV